MTDSDNVCKCARLGVAVSLLLEVVVNLSECVILCHALFL